MSYHACGICRKEFFSDEEYLKHPCCASGKAGAEPVVNGRLADMPMGMAIAGAGPEAVFRMAREKMAMDAAKAEADDGAQELSEASLERVDQRLAAAKGMIAMKKELAKAGVQAGTLNEEDTRAEYERLSSRRKAQKQEEVKGA